jgi:hypothetical protein
MNTKKWTTKDGTKIRIKDMTDSHLLNTLRLLERTASLMIVECPCDGDKDWCFCGRNRHYEPEDLTPLYFDLKKEAVRRGLLEPADVNSFYE